MRYKISVQNDLEAKLDKRTNSELIAIKGERRAMKTLKKNQGITVKPADKGGVTEIT